MTTIRQEILPPIIVDIVQTVLNDKQPVHVRENACIRLEQIAENCSLVAKQFRATQINQNVMKKRRR